MSDTPPPLDSPEPQPAQQPVQAAPASGGSSGKTLACCGIGCVSLIVVAIVGVILAFAWGKKALTNFAVEATSEESAEVVVVPVEPTVTQSAMAKVDAFAAGWSGSGELVPLELDAAEVNAILQNHPNFSMLSDNTIVAIEGEVLSATTSIPLDAVLSAFPEIPEVLKGRYFNGSISATADTVGGKPALFLRDISTQGGSLPAWLVEGLKQQNLLQNAESDPEMKKIFDRIEELKIENGKLVILPRP